MKVSSLKKCLMGVAFDDIFFSTLTVVMDVRSASIIIAFGLKVKSIALYFMNVDDLPYVTFSHRSQR